MSARRGHPVDTPRESLAGIGAGEATRALAIRGSERRLQITVYGVPAPKGSRTLGRRKDGSVYTRPASKHEHPWVEAVAKTAAARAGQGLNLPQAPYRVRLDFYCPKPKRPSHPHPSRHDVDKLARAVLDGLVRGGLLTDDRHVVELEAVKHWATPGGEGVRVKVEEALELKGAAA